MISKNKILYGYFFILFSVIPISIVVGSAVSLANILLIDLSFIILLLCTKEFYFLKNKTIIIILLFCLYLIFNSLISQDFSIGATRNFGYIRFLVLFVAFNYFFYKNKYFNKILIIWALSLFIICLDVYFESYFKKNMLGYGGPDVAFRIVSFFKDEPIVGGYINAFYLMIAGYFFLIFKDYPKKYKSLFLVVTIILFISILLTGERSSAIKALIGFLLFYFLNKNFALGEKIISIILMITLISGLILSSDFLKLKYFHQETFQTNINENKYFRLYRSGLSIFKNYPLFGVGNKNYRIEACTPNLDVEAQSIFYTKKEMTSNYSYYECQTHPHQIYFEFLSEHGAVGSIIILVIFFKLIFSKLKIILRAENYLQLGCIIYLLTVFVPILPSGAFFSDNFQVLFWLNLSILYASNSETNIFNKIKF